MYRSAQRRGRTATSRTPLSKEGSPRRLRMVLLVVVSALAVVGLRYANLSLLDQRLVHINELPDSVVSAGFSLGSDRELQIDVVGTTQVRQRTGGRGPVNVTLENVWVIEATTKAPVWDMRETSVTRGADGALAYQGAIVLPEGKYLLFCSVHTEEQRPQDGSWVNWLDADREIRASETESESDSEDFHVTVSGRGKQLSGSEIVAVLQAPAASAPSVETERSRPSETSRVRNAATGDDRTGRVLVNLTRLEDNEAKFALFSLTQRTDLRVYAVGEGANGEMHDYGWIVNTANGRTVWEMRYQDTEHAGGDGKNRYVDATISLRRGDYVVYFVTDDSHSYEDWNGRRPSDEESWGITVVESGSATDWLPAGEYILRYRSDDSHSPESWNDDPPDDFRNYGVTVFVEHRNR